MEQKHYKKLLPEFLRDFHDQKDFFKALQTFYSEGENKIPCNWIDNHVYTIDFFLWFMALHGYRLQRFKSKKFQQYDPLKFIEDSRQKRLKQLSKILKSKYSVEEDGTVMTSIIHGAHGEREVIGNIYENSDLLTKS